MQTVNKINFCCELNTCNLSRSKMFPFQSANAEVVSSFSAPVEVQSVEVSSSSTPPIDSSQAPSHSSLASASHLEPAATEEFEVSEKADCH